MCGQKAIPPDSDELYRIAEQQAGYFTARQAGQAGFTVPLLTHHARRQRFIRVRHGIYRLAQFPEMPHSDLFIAWLRAGPNSVISHESALALYDLSDLVPAAIHVTIPRTGSRRRPGLNLHTARLGHDEVTHLAGLPVTTIPRTLADLISGGWPEEHVVQAVREALSRGLVTREQLLDYAATRSQRVERVISRALAAEGAR